MGNKDGYDPSTTRWASVLRNPWKIEQGELVLLETKPREAERLFWVGRTTITAYWLMFDTPQTIFEVVTWLGHQQDMILAHDGELDIVDMDKHGELPF
ncbi:hypothetical protein ACO1ZG_16310 [Enterobacter kobei]|uniref:hypothetical protein n=1 Tax=Enterobacter kobei TaxID=208224 RepID=UPI003B88AAC0